jgi:hypothetical protein
MQFILFVCVKTPFRPENPQELGAATGAWVDELERRGAYASGDRLRPAADAKTIRVRDGERVVSDGAFAQTEEQICGYDLIECAGVDEAVEIASTHPMARFGAIEVRAVWPL